MFTIDIRGIDRLIAQLEKRAEDYQVAVESATELARETILLRVYNGQLTEGGFGNMRMTKSNPPLDRYSQRWGKQRKKKGLSTKTHNLSYTGGLYRNFIIKKTKSINKKNLVFSRTLEFTNYRVAGSNITYAQLAKIQEDYTGIGFQLSPSQFTRVMARFKQVARL